MRPLLLKLFQLKPLGRRPNAGPRYNILDGKYLRLPNDVTKEVYQVSEVQVNRGVVEEENRVIGVENFPANAVRVTSDFHSMMRRRSGINSLPSREKEKSGSCS